MFWLPFASAATANRKLIVSHLFFWFVPHLSTAHSDIVNCLLRCFVLWQCLPSFISNPSLILVLMTCALVCYSGVVWASRHRGHCTKMKIRTHVTCERWRHMVFGKHEPIVTVTKNQVQKILFIFFFNFLFSPRRIRKYNKIDEFWCCFSHCLSGLFLSSHLWPTLHESSSNIKKCSFSLFASLTTFDNFKYVFIFVSMVDKLITSNEWNCEWVCTGQATNKTSCPNHNENFSGMSFEMELTETKFILLWKKKWKIRWSSTTWFDIDPSNATHSFIHFHFPHS